MNFLNRKYVSFAASLVAADGVVTPLPAISASITKNWCLELNEPTRQSLDAYTKPMTPAESADRIDFTEQEQPLGDLELLVKLSQEVLEELAVVEDPTDLRHLRIEIFFRSAKLLRVIASHAIEGVMRRSDVFSSHRKTRTGVMLHPISIRCFRVALWQLPTKVKGTK